MKKKILPFLSMGLCLVLTACSLGSAVTTTTAANNDTTTTENTTTKATTTEKENNLLDIQLVTIKSKAQIDAALGNKYTIGINYGTKSVSSAGVVSYGKSSVTKVNEEKSYTKIATTKTSSIALEYYYSENGTYYEYNSTAGLFNKMVKTEDVYQNGAWDIISATFGKTVPYTTSEVVEYKVDSFVRQATHYNLDVSLTKTAGTLKLDFIIDNETGIPLEYAFEGSSSAIKLDIGKTQFSVLNINVGEPDFSDAPERAVETAPRSELLTSCYLDNFFTLPKEDLNALECSTKWIKKNDDYVNNGFKGIYDNITFDEAKAYCDGLFRENITYKSTSTKANTVEDCYKNCDSELKVIDFDIFYKTNALSGSTARIESEIKVIYSETNGLTIEIIDK